MPDVVRIGNAQAFWGDDPDAPARLLRQAPDLDYLTLDYLAEVSMSILAKLRQRDPAAGYARDFLDVVTTLAPLWRSGQRTHLVTNAGGLNPVDCARSASRILREAGCCGLRIGIVSGDDVLPLLMASLKTNDHDAFRHLESGDSLATVAERLVTANAYLGAAPIAEALAGGADWVITGRIADPSLTVGPCVAHFGWSWRDFDRLAGATVAGHLIECGTQVTGGISSRWMDLPRPAEIGFPIVEIAADGSCVVTKPRDSGGAVNEWTVKEQLLYELGDPARYLSPDATVSFLSLVLDDLGGNRVHVGGATGSPPPPSYKVSATYRAGYKASGMLTIIGRDAVAKGRRCGKIVLQHLRNAGCEPQRSRVECLGAGDAATGFPPREDLSEIVLRVTVADDRREVVERFSRQFACLISAGPQGITGYSEGRPVVREIFGYWPTLIDRRLVPARIDYIEV